MKPVPARGFGRGPAHASGWSAGHPPGRVKGLAFGAGGPGERLLLGLAGTAAVLVLWVWATGQLAARLTHGRWLAGSPATALAVLLRLPAAIGHPAAAWPTPVRPLLPATGVLDAVGLALLGLGLVLAAAAVTAVRRMRIGPSGRRPFGSGGRAWAPALGLFGSGSQGGAGGPDRRAQGGARWAGARDVRPLIVPAPRPGRLVLGRLGRRLLATEARHSVLVLGPTQSGKTTGLAVPAILEWDGPVVATSVKADLAADTLGWRSHCGQCWVFDPTGTSGLAAPGGWSPLAEARDWTSSQRVAGWMVDATPARQGLSDAAFWYAAAAKQLAPLLLAARCGARDMGAVVRWTDLGEWDEPIDLLEGAAQADAVAALTACAGRDERIRSSVATTLETVLAPFSDPAVVAATAGRDIDPALLLQGRHTLYLCGPTYEQARLAGLIASLVQAVVAAAVDAATVTGRPLDPPLLVVLDEAANIAPIRDLDALASTGAALGIQLVTVCQDLAQLTTRYGADRARTIANNHRAKLALSGVADLGTLDLLSGLAGEAAVREETMTSDLRDGRRSRTSSVAYRRLAPTDELRRIPPGHGVLVYGHLPAARIALRPWYADPGLRRRAGAGR